MKQKNFETILYSTAGVAVMFVVLLAFYVITSAFKERIDLTSEKAFTLSSGTKKILNKLDSRVTIRFYCTQDASMPPVLRTYAQHVEDLLGEYKEAGHGKVVIEKLDPKLRTPTRRIRRDWTEWRDKRHRLLAATKCTWAWW